MEHLDGTPQKDLEKIGSSGQKPNNDFTLKVMCEVFDELIGIFGQGRWRTGDSLAEAKIQYTKAFMESGLGDIRKISIGLEKCRALKNTNFVPTCGDFIAMCTPTAEDLGLPTLIKAYDEACKNSYPGSTKNWSHPSVYHMWKTTGANFLSTHTREAALPTFERNYDATVRMLINGELLTDIPLGIENKKTDANYQEYWGEFKNDRDALKIRPKTDKPLTRAEWNEDPDPK